MIQSFMSCIIYKPFSVKVVAILSDNHLIFIHPTWIQAITFFYFFCWYSEILVRFLWL
uniref:Uncharacterized protein n=1 Tax=Rhizophora mucronata TaxID=61149 RepID=A0A2P2QXF9_RHIMU